MKKIALERFVENVEALMDEAQHEHILIVRDGQPFVLPLGMVYRDVEDLHLETSPEFWRMIEERRREPTVRLEDVKEQLLRDDEAEPAAPRVVETMSVQNNA